MLCSYLEKQLLAGGKKFLIGENVTIADLYATIVLSWAQWVGVDLSPYPAVVAYSKGIQASDVWQNGQKVLATKPASI